MDHVSSSDELVAEAARVLPRLRLLANIATVAFVVTGVMLLVAGVFGIAWIAGSDTPRFGIVLDVGSLAGVLGMAIGARYELRRWGAPPVLLHGVIALTLGFVVATIGPHLVGRYPDPIAQLNNALAVAEAVVLFAAWQWPQRFIRIIGPRPGWLVLERYARLFANAAPDGEGLEDAHAVMVRCVADLETFRAPETIEFIDAFRAWTDLEEPFDSPIGHRFLIGFRLAEFRLYLRLGGVPAWYLDTPWLDQAGVARNGYLLPEQMRLSLA